MPCGSCKNLGFGGKYRLHNQVGKISELETKLAITSNLLVTVNVVLSLNRQFIQEPHGVTSQKTEFFIVTTVKTSNLTRRFLPTCFSSAVGTIPQSPTNVLLSRVRF
jgi:hypothetical protein